jgi:hypothetical protein
MIEIIGVKSCELAFYDTLDILLPCEITLGEDIFLAKETFFLDLVLIVDPIK